MKRRCLGCMEQYDDKFKVCPHCGFVIGTRAEIDIQMQPGSLLHDRYIIGKALGSGGFGVTYLAWDGRLEQKVAVKEYLPGEFSTRMPGSSLVTVFNGEKGEQFNDGMKKLIEESKRLSKFQNEPGIVKIFDSFEENNTAYIVMEYLDGMTLASYLEHVGTINEDEAVSMLMPVMASLQTVHEAGLLHRDIAPDNIFLTKTGEVKLIDFGAARYATTTHSRSLTVIIKPGYSPEEQYRSNGNQGPYTDVHALAATLYKMITGVRPADAMDRYSECETKGRDLLVPLHKFDKNISKNRENAILNGLNVRIEDRTADVGAFIDELNSEKPVKIRYGKIKKIDIYSWPLWVKILIPVVVAAIAVFGILIGAGVFETVFSSIGRNKIEGYEEVPNVVRKSENDAKNELEEAGFNYIVSGGMESDIIKKDMICQQFPKGGSYIEKWTIIKCTISQGNGKVEKAIDGVSVIPYFKGYTKDEIIERFEIAGLIPIFEEVESDYEEGLVCGIEHGYSEGQEVPEGTEITLLISKGATVEIPEVEGKLKDDAVSELKECGFDVKLDYVNDDNVEKDIVISQSAAPGEKLKKGDTVKLIVSSGEEMFVLPYVIGHTKKDAVDMIKNHVNFNDEYSSVFSEGTVMRVDRYEEGDLVPKSEIVILIVSEGPKPVEVIFDGNGGKAEYTEKENYLDKPYEMPNATRDGYTFAGWYTDKNEGSKIKPGDIVEVDIPHTLYAQWTPKEYTITFNANGGTVTQTSQKVKYDSEYGTLPTPTKTGYGFDGWYDSKTGGNEVLASDMFTKTSNQTLYAHWESNACTVVFDANGGEVDEQNRSVSYGSPYGDLPTPSRPGYVFKGWYTSPSGGTKISSSTKVSNENEHTLYAQWKEKTYTVTFDASGGTLSSKTKTVTYGSPYGSLPTPKKDYHTFIGWYTEDEKLVIQTTTVDITKNITLYAKYKENPIVGPVLESEVPADAQRVSTKIQYRYRDKKTTTSEQYPLSGWTEISSKRETKTVRGEWSEWDTTPLYESETYEAESKLFYRYYYYKCPNCGNHSPYYGKCSKCGASVSKDSCWVETMSPIRYVDSDCRIWDSNKCYTTSLGDGQLWFFEKANMNVNYECSFYVITFYRGRTKNTVTTYYYYKWTDWSSWSDTKYTKTDTREVQTQTVVTYREK